MSARCEKEGISEGKQAIPARVLAARAKAAAGNAKSSQTTLDAVFLKTKVPTLFSKEGILEAVVKHIVCDDQVRCA